MMINVLVDSNIAAMLLLKLMEPEQQAALVEFRCAHPTSSLYAAAKTLLEIRNEPVALVLDADSTEPMMAARVRDEAVEVIGESAAAAPLRILVAVPAVESLLFRRAEAVRRAYGNTTSDLIDLGLVSPGDALQKMNGVSDRYHASFKIITKLNTDDIAALRVESPVRELLEFLDELKGIGAKSVAAATP
jgi:hypothetical protein